MTILSTATDRRKPVLSIRDRYATRRQPPLAHLLLVLADMRAESLARDNEDHNEVVRYLERQGRRDGR